MSHGKERDIRVTLLMQRLTFSNFVWMSWPE